ncbi:MAG: oligosaccharide flippase family protein, partial [Patescibacteria group bacterium]
MFKNTLGNTIIAFSFRIIGTIISIVYLAVLTRYLGLENFGYYSGALAYIYIFSFLADLGLYNLMIREISHSAADENKISSNIFTLRLVALFISLSIGATIIWLTDFNIIMKVAVVISSFHFLFLGAAQPLIGIFQKHLRIIWYSGSEVFSRALQLGLLFLVIYLKGGILGAISILSIGGLVAFIIMLIGLRNLVKIRLRFDFSYWKWVLRETWPMAAIVIFASIYFKIDEVMLSFLKTPTDVGIYGAGYKIVQSLVFFPA